MTKKPGDADEEEQSVMSVSVIKDLLYMGLYNSPH